jgi:predicted kinase
MLVAHCRQYADRIQGIFFDIPLSVCLDRNMNPDGGRVVSEEIIDSIAQRISDYPPTMADGFDEIITIRR